MPIVQLLRLIVYCVIVKISNLDKSGVYQIICGNCDVVYVEQTCERVGTRVKEYISRPDKSVFGIHIQKTGHTKLLHQAEKGKKLTLL